MGKIIIDGEELRAVTLNTASARAVIELQRELGLTLQQISTQALDPMEQVWALKVQEFLTEHNRGNPVTFDELLDRPMAVVVPDADEIARYRASLGEGEGTDPTSAGTVTPAGPGHEQPSAPKAAEPNRAERRTKTPRSPRSGVQNPG